MMKKHLCCLFFIIIIIIVIILGKVLYEKNAKEKTKNVELETNLKNVFFKDISEEKFEEISHEGKMMYSEDETTYNICKYVFDGKVLYMEIEIEGNVCQDLQLHILNSMRINDKIFGLYRSDNHNEFALTNSARYVDDGQINQTVEKDGKTIVVVKKIDSNTDKLHFMEKIVDDEGNKTYNCISEMDLVQTVEGRTFCRESDGREDIYISPLGIHLYKHGMAIQSAKLSLEYSNGKIVDVNSIMKETAGGKTDEERFVYFDLNYLNNVDDIVAIYSGNVKYLPKDE